MRREITTLIWYNSYFYKLMVIYFSKCGGKIRRIINKFSGNSGDDINHKDSTPKERTKTEVQSHDSAGPIINLRVDSMIPGDDTRGKALVDPETMHLLDMSPGDFVTIEGSRRAVAKAWHLSFDDWNLEKIRFGHIIRMNAGVSVGDTVKVIKMTEKAEVKRIILEPNINLSKHTKDKLISDKTYVLTEISKVYPVKNNYVSLKFECNLCSIITFRVVDLEPEAAVIFTDKTSLEFSDKTVILTNKDIQTDNKKIIRDIPSNSRCKNCNEKIYLEEIIQCGPCGKFFCIFCWESHRWSHGKSPAIGISYQSDGTFSGFDGTERFK